MHLETERKFSRCVFKSSAIFNLTLSLKLGICGVRRSEKRMNASCVNTPLHSSKLLRAFFVYLHGNKLNPKQKCNIIIVRKDALDCADGVLQMRCHSNFHL